MGLFDFWKKKDDAEAPVSYDQLSVDNPEVITDGYIDNVPSSVTEMTPPEPDFSDDPDKERSANVDQTPDAEPLSFKLQATASGHTTPEAVLAWCRSQIGYHEGPNNYNKYAPIAGHANNQPWCDTFMCAAFKSVGQTIPLYSAYTPASEAGYKAAGRLGTVPRVGAEFFYYSASAGRIDHTGIVERVNSDGTVTTIEGNYGDAVRRNVRANLRSGHGSGIASYGYPEYSSTPGPAPHPTPGAPSVGIVKALQKAVRVPADGVWGPQTDLALRAVLNYNNNTGVPTKYLQERVGTKVDGAWGPNSIKARSNTVRNLQKLMKGVDVDGANGPKTWARFLQYRAHYYKH